MSATQLADVFGALSDPTRLAIVERLLSEGERTAGEIAKPFAVSKPAISKHLKVLEDAGLIERRVHRQWRVCRARPETIKTIDDWMNRYRAFWEASFDRLGELIEAQSNEDSDNG